MNNHTQLLEELATASRAIDRAQAFAYAQSQLAGDGYVTPARWSVITP
jgi:hypothetical protein